MFVGNLIDILLGDWQQAVEILICTWINNF